MNKPAAFITSRSFQGKKDGYLFKNGDEGVGYYLDPINPYLQAAPSAHKVKINL